MQYVHLQVKAKWKPELPNSSKLQLLKHLCLFILQQDHCGVTEILSWQEGSYYLLWMRVSAECLEGKDTKDQSRAKQTVESKREQNRDVFSLLFCPVSVLFSLHQNPLAIVQQQAASLHMFGYCSITLLLPPAYSFNRPCWLTCYIKMISTLRSINLPQSCKILIYYNAGSTAG